ncbi:hypothetical protein XMM379_001913 [Aliiroseovarius sp. xm-m-379]|uniref:H-NS family nucleoid-associated regulatory protein n=1 Tax=unclassified Aliiroseovarius TaxID=2623558 RepID=UPI001567C7A5|nr:MULTISPECIES: H-NS family nucleoid-associated regulatory protein [unclassified Aliiroseovarius]NRP25219.1 hypothetical protein [Aliiroseovarius sp. xm-m-379]NRP34018.1 hypothetical protein [Aliiroseovarius sp. xm-a-104]NRP50804.1 hypothetical protein [Aliiroseovarius sp. xm-m-354]NRQ05556.1 hypothetical protein [Aliiroseovarius sp. xm-m-309]NRQ08761.1 hypothetical protein [Aliiroseovarius sp. xm-v-201]
MDDMDDSLRKEQELEAQMQALKDELAAVRAANRDAVVADVKAKIKRYAITRTELATAFPVLRKPRASTRSKVNADGTIPKKRGRKPKQQTQDSAE